MKVIQITDDDAKDLMKDLKIAGLTDPVLWETGPALGPDRDLQQSVATAYKNDVHRHFHFHVVRWLQKHGAKIT